MQHGFSLHRLHYGDYPINKLEVKCRADSFFNSVFLRLRRFKTGSKNNLHVQIQSAIVDYYGKQQFNCIASVDSAGGNTTTKSTLIKLRRLINSIHYLAKDDAHVLAWCKTIPTQRSSDWAARITLKSVINQLEGIGCKQNNKAPYFWSTYKTFKFFVQSDNYFN